MNKIDKFLRKLSYKERLEIEKTIGLIILEKFDGLDIKKLKGINNLFRVRKGRIRIIYGITFEKMPIIIAIDYRNDTTYSI